MLLIDRILKDKVGFATDLNGVRVPGDHERARAKLRADLSKPEALNTVDSVAEHLYAGTDQEDFNARDFPCFVPIHTSFWTECSRPSAVRSEKVGIFDPKLLPRRWGVLWSGGVKQPSEKATPEFRALNPKFAAACEGRGWLMVTQIAVEDDAGIVLVVPMFRLFAISEQGIEEDSVWMGNSKPPPTAEQFELLQATTALFLPHQLAIRYMNEGRAAAVHVEADSSTGSSAHERLGPVGAPGTA